MITATRPATSGPRLDGDQDNSADVLRCDKKCPGPSLRPETRRSRVPGPRRPRTQKRRPAVARNRQHDPFNVCRHTRLRGHRHAAKNTPFSCLSGPHRRRRRLAPKRAVRERTTRGQISCTTNDTNALAENPVRRADPRRREGFNLGQSGIAGRRVGRYIGNDLASGQHAVAESVEFRLG